MSQYFCYGNKMLLNCKKDSGLLLYYSICRSNLFQVNVVCCINYVRYTVNSTTVNSSPSEYKHFVQIIRYNELRIHFNIG